MDKGQEALFKALDSWEAPIWRGKYTCIIGWFISMVKLVLRSGKGVVNEHSMDNRLFKVKGEVRLGGRWCNDLLQGRGSGR